MGLHERPGNPIKQRLTAAALAGGAAAVLVLAALGAASGSALPTSAAAAVAEDPPALVEARSELAYCNRLAQVGSSSAQRARGRTCAADAQRVIDSFATSPPTTTPPSSTNPPSSTAPPTTVPPTITVPPTTTMPPTTPPPTTPPPGDTLFCPPYAGVNGPFPDEHCTGWRHTGVTLHTCGDPAGSATHLETAGATYDGCEFRDSVVIQAENITIRRSWVHGNVYPQSDMRTPDGKPDCKGLKLIDVEVGPSDSPDLAGVGNCFNKSLLRVNVHGTASGVHVSDFNSVVDSWSHGFTDTGSHGAAAGTGQDMGNHSVIVHSNLDCVRLNPSGVEDPSIRHCSSALSLYDEPTLDDVLVERNLFNSVSGFCAYGGNTGTNIRFVDNTFGQKYFNACAPEGPITVFFFHEGNVWTNNRFADGRVVTPPSA